MPATTTARIPLPVTNAGPIPLTLMAAPPAPVLEPCPVALRLSAERVLYDVFGPEAFDPPPDVDAVIESAKFLAGLAGKSERCNAYARRFVQMRPGLLDHIQTPPPATKATPPAIDPETEILDRDAAAAYLGFTKATIYEMSSKRDGRLPTSSAGWTRPQLREAAQKPKPPKPRRKKPKS